MKNMNNQNPLISIIMPVYNAGDFLVEAIDSIKKQTYINWELIAVNDGSIDNSLMLLRKIAKKDSRIKVFDLKENLGLGAAANLAIQNAQGKYLARFDADDLMPKNRLELQVNYFIKNPEVLAVGGQCAMISEKGKTLGKKTFPLSDDKIRKMAFMTMSLQAGSMMINRSNLPKDFEFYSTVHHYFEDHELLFKLLLQGKVANLPQTLLYYRQHPDNSTKKVKIKKIFFSLLKLRVKAMIGGLLPDIKGVLTNIAQLILVLLLPEKIIEKLYFFMRISLNKKFITKMFKPIYINVKNLRSNLPKSRAVFSVK